MTVDIQVILNQIAVLFILLAVGFAAGKLKILSKDGNRILTQIVLFIALPCTIINSVLGNELDLSLGDALYYLLICFLAFALAFAVSIPVIRLTRGDKENHGLLTFMSVFSNCGFMGFPVTLALFGATGGLYTAIFNIPFNLLSFSIGVMLIAGKKGSFDPKLLLNPPLIASLVAIPIAFTGFMLPPIAAEAIRLTGGITTPGAMIVVGSALSFIPFKNVISEWRVGVSSALKLIIIPVLTWLVFRNFIEDSVMLGVLVILTAMPTAAQSTMLAISYDGNEKISSAGVFVTTLLCVITVPLLGSLLL